MSAKAAVIRVGCAALAIVAAPAIGLLTGAASAGETRISVVAHSDAGEVDATWIPYY